MSRVDRYDPGAIEAVRRLAQEIVDHAVEGHGADREAAERERVRYRAKARAAMVHYGLDPAEEGHIDAFAAGYFACLADGIWTSTFQALGASALLDILEGNEDITEIIEEFNREWSQQPPDNRS